MRFPPDTFSGLKNGQWATPMMISFGLFMAAATHEIANKSEIIGLIFIITIMSYILAWYAIYRSIWGSRHQIVSAITEFILFVIPWSILLLPLVSKSIEINIHILKNNHLSLYTALLLFITLLASALYHANHCVIPKPDSSILHWPGCKIDLKKHRICSSMHNNGTYDSYASIFSIGTISVMLYGGISAWISEVDLILFGAILALAGGLWLCIFPIGKALGQGCMLRKIENQRGYRCHTERIKWLESERHNKKK